jgi:hypothetical protein
VAGSTSIPGKRSGNRSETKRDYKIVYGRPPRGRPFQKGQSGPRGKNRSALLIAEMNEPLATVRRVRFQMSSIF